MWLYLLEIPNYYITLKWVIRNDLYCCAKTHIECLGHKGTHGGGAKTEMVCVIGTIGRSRV